MERVNFYINQLKQMLAKKNYAVSRADMDVNITSAVEELTKEVEKSRKDILTLAGCVPSSNVTVKFSLLDEKAVLPKYAKAGDAGLDLTAVGLKLVNEGDYYEYDLGMSVEIPTGYVGLLFPRSSVSNTDLSLANCVGVIDSGYRGRLTARFRKTTDDKNLRTYKVGDRVAQLLVLPYPTVTIEQVSEDDLSASERGTGGFGSSGK